MLVDEKAGDPNSVYAEQSSYNWVLAIFSEVINHHGDNVAAWKTSLDAKFASTQAQKPKQTVERKIFQKMFHGIVLGNSIRFKYRANHFNHCDIVGTISDFYYALYNLFISIAMARDVLENDKHGKNISIFHNTKNILPYPFNISGAFEPSTWNGKTFLNQNNFKCELPGLLTSTQNSAGHINGTYSGANLLKQNIAQDIVHGYLLGTIDYYIGAQRTSLEKEQKRKLNLKTDADKALINPRIKKLQISFMNCLYRYRTKAHYRDFSFLAYEYTDKDGKTNNTMNIELYNCMATIIEFACCATIIHAKQRLGKNLTKAFLADISAKIKDRIPAGQDYWNSLI